MFKIGVFDSGLGGLTVVKALTKILKRYSIVYFGDSAHLPYGNKSKNTVIKLSLSNAEFLLKQNVNLIVVACNTASSLSLNTLKKNITVPVIGVIEPAVKSALLATKNKRVGVIGTLATINSKTYCETMRRISTSIKVFEKACPLFVPLVEEGLGSHKLAFEVAKMYLEKIKKEKIDTLILGCTHYPLIKNAIKRVMGNNVNLIDSADEVAKEVENFITHSKITLGGNRNIKFYVNDLPQKLYELAKIFMGRSIPKPILVKNA